MTALHDCVGTGLAPVADLAAIELNELVEAASLLARVDRKYVLPIDEVPGLLAAAPRSTRVLEIAGRRTFGYRSTYLDTRDRASFLAAGRRHRRRFKVRTRAYLDTGSCWLEVKTRRGRDLTVKQRIGHHDAEFGALTPEGHHFVDECLGEAGIGPTAARLEPVLVTAYSRSTLYLPETRSRVTVDTDLGWTSLAGTARPDLDRPGVAVVETKTGSTASAFDRLLWAHGHRPLQISKYGVGMAALHPDLPRLKWHRVLATQLDVPNPTDTTRRTR